MEGRVYSALARRLARHSGEAFPLHIGDTWMEPPRGCRMEDITAADHPGMHRYAPVQGTLGLLDAIVEWTEARGGGQIEREQVLVATGATGGLGAVVGALARATDRRLERWGTRLRLRPQVGAVDRRLLRWVHRALFTRVHARVPPPAV